MVDVSVLPVLVAGLGVVLTYLGFKTWMKSSGNIPGISNGLISYLKLNRVFEIDRFLIFLFKRPCRMAYCRISTVFRSDAILWNHGKFDEQIRIHF